MTAPETAGKPVLLLVAADSALLAELVADLERRFERDYQVVTEDSPAAAAAALERLRAESAELALVIADERMPDHAGYELLASVHELYPTARRAILMAYADLSTNPRLNRAMALSQLDSYIMQPWDPAEEALYRPVGELLADWAAASRRPRFEAVKLVGARWDARSHALRDNLERNGLPYGFYAAEELEGQALLRAAGCDDSRLPVLVLFDGRVLVQPSVADVASAFGIRTRADPGVYDLAVVGAGPAGLSAAVYGASEGLRTLHLERDAIGGQAGTTSRIRNYMGFPRGVAGGRLTLSAHQQAVFFGAVFVIGEVTALTTSGADRVLTMADGSEAVARAVVISTGASYRRLDVPALESLIGRGVFYGAATAEARAMAGEEVFVVGAGNSAGQAALHLAQEARQVTLVVRGEGLERSMADYLIREIESTPNIGVRPRTRVVDGGGSARLERLTLEDDVTSERQETAAGGLFVLIGAEPHTDWLAPTLVRDDGGYLLTGRDLQSDGQPPPGWPLQRPPGLSETSVPGVFAAGDVRHGSINRVAAAAGDGSTAIQLVHAYLDERN